MFKDNERIIKTFLEPPLHTHIHTHTRTKTNNVTRNVESFTKNLDQKTKLNKLFIETGSFGQFHSHFSSLVAKIPIRNTSPRVLSDYFILHTLCSL